MAFTRITTALAVGALSAGLLLQNTAHAQTIVGSPSTPSESYGLTGVIPITVTYSEDVVITPGAGITLPITVGTLTGESATLVTTGTTDTLVFEYIVPAGNANRHDTDGIEINNDIVLGAGATLTNVGATNNASLDADAGTTLMGATVDILPPAVSSVSDPAVASYGAGQNLDFVVTMNEPVAISGGLPGLSLDIGGTTRTATFTGLTGGDTEVNFRYTIVAADTDADGIGRLALLTANAIVDVVDNGNANASSGAGFSSLDPLSGVLVDGLAPSVVPSSPTSDTQPPANGDYQAGQVLAFSLEFTEDVTVTGTPRIELNIGGQQRFALFSAADSSPTVLVFNYSIAPADLDTDGINSPSPLDLNGGTVRDGAGNDATLPPIGFGPLSDVTVRAASTLPNAVPVNQPLVLLFMLAGLAYLSRRKLIK